MSNNKIDGEIITINENVYFFDNIVAYPIKCKCGGNIVEEVTEYNAKEFNHSTNMYDILVADGVNDLHYECFDCMETFYTLRKLNNGEWD